MLEAHWYALEWNLSRARTLDGVRKTLAIEQFKLNPGPLAPLLRESFERASKKQLEKTRNELGQANERSRSAQDKHQEQLQACNEAERVEFSVSEQAEEDIRRELQRRTSNLSTIGEAIEAIQQLIRDYEFWHKTRAIPGVPSPQVTALTDLLGKLERHRQADEPVCAQLAARIRAITPEVRKIAVENAARQKSLLISAQGEQKGAYQFEKVLRAKFLDQEAFIYRNEMLKFLQAKEYRLSPFTLASAIAGLPYISARHSAQRCSSKEARVRHSTTYEMFQFSKRIWNRCGRRLGSSLSERFEREIRKLPKFIIVKGHRQPNWFRTQLAKDWHYLRTTLQDPELPKLNPGTVPGAIVATFLRKRSNPESPVTPTIAEAERITD
jgi:hypothetical protein